MRELQGEDSWGLSRAGVHAARTLCARVACAAERVCRARAESEAGSLVVVNDFICKEGEGCVRCRGIEFTITFVERSLGAWGIGLLLELRNLCRCAG
jgi:hypothetical protein